MSYEAYLSKNQYSQSTITVHKLRIRRFKSWLKRHGMTAHQLNYSTLLKYAKYLQTEKHYERQSTNNELRAVKLYYDYLMDKGELVDNPADDMAIRGKHIKVINNLLNEEELEDLYYSYDIEHYDTFFKATKLRDKVVLGLMVFQGITAIELYHLQEEYLQLNRGKIDIPSTRRSNARTMKLQPLQMMDLMNYINTQRPYLSKRMTTDNTEQFVFGTINQVYCITHRIIRNLKLYNHKVISHSQIRSSLIVNWLSKHNLRQVQYLAGHRYISSTEKYIQDDLENLHEIVNNFHPIS
ncbi:tyrosine-type recombinase/integrase [Tenacibaculum amylolyticum]|uniref:tyrosine-type recombinase/integrase n=1 Tax=Tenacibaculum amylolyticum TaxID=104269 RepID=UPI0038966C4C